MNDVAKALGLAEAPLRIECYDISNTVGGAFQVASMVVFEDAIAKKSEYRRFAIRGKDGKGAVDDLSALYETLTRRFKHGNIAGDSGESIDAEQRVASAAGKMTTAVAAETIAANGNDNGEGGSDISGKGHAVPVGVQNDARESPPDIVQQNTNRHHFAYKPNLVVVDGGKPQVMAAAKALEDCDVNDVAVCGLAKRLEEVWVPDDDYPIILKRQSEGMYLLQRVRDDPTASPSPTTASSGAKAPCAARSTRFPASAKATRSGCSTTSARSKPCAKPVSRTSRRSKASATPKPKRCTTRCTSSEPARSSSPE